MGIDNANAKQFGGDHYKKHEYQHWDFVCDLQLPYLIGCATKYVARWRDKGGRLDLEKAVHYLEKALERDVKVGPYQSWRLAKFCAQLPKWEAEVIHMIMDNLYESAIGEIDFLLENGL